MKISKMLRYSDLQPPALNKLLNCIHCFFFLGLSEILTEEVSLVSYLFRTYYKEIKIDWQANRQADTNKTLVLPFITVS